MTTPHDLDEEMARWLRATLADAERDLAVGADGLTRIRAKVDRRRRRLHWWHAGEFVGAAAAVVVVVAAAVGSLPLPWAPHKASTTDKVTTTGTSPQIPQAGPGPMASPLATATNERTRAVTVYYVGHADGVMALYGEVHERPVPADGATIRDSIEAMLREEPYDPTYSSPWPSTTTILGISVKGSTVVVDLSASAADGPPGISRGLGHLAALQLLYTVRGSVDASAIALRIDHEPVAVLWGDNIATGRPADEPLITDTEASEGAFAPVQLQAPAWGAKLGTQVTFGGQARVFEGTVSWEITSATDGTVVRTGAALTSAALSGWGEWTANVTLTPGSYVLRAFEISPKDGARRDLTTKLFSVE